MADDWQQTADAVNRAVTGAMESLEDVFDKERTIYGGSTWVESLTSSAGVGKGFRFPSVEDANKIINSFKDRRDSMERRRNQISKTKAALMRRFSDDDTSIQYIQRALESLDSLNVLNESAIEYTGRYIEKIEKAKRSKMETEEESSSNFDMSTGGS